MIFLYIENMKDIISYINESKCRHFILSDDERDRLSEIIGYASANFGDDNETNKFKSFRNSLSEQELEDMNNLYDTLNDIYTYPKFTNKIITNEDINICNKLFAYLSNLNEWDLSDIAETIGIKY